MPALNQATVQMLSPPRPAAIQEIEAILTN
jgi:hypothetical protein